MEKENSYEDKTKGDGLRLALQTLAGVIDYARFAGYVYEQTGRLLKARASDDLNEIVQWAQNQNGAFSLQLFDVKHDEVFSFDLIEGRATFARFHRYGRK